MQEQVMVMTRGFRNVTRFGETVGFELLVRVPYYRGVFLSLVHELILSVDGREYSPDDIEIEVGGRCFTHAGMMEADDVRWDYGTPATLRARHAGGLTPGLHAVKVGMTIRKSYIPPEDPEHLLDFAWREGKYTPFFEPPSVVTRRMTLVQ
ncbi:MAG: hypothetical protein RLZZ200_2214 [Pseudomonadota bacterium]|jgi:hypothetical protein